MKNEIIGEAGGIPGLVRIICDNKGNPKRVDIDKLVFRDEDKGLISDLFVAALDDLNKKLKEKEFEHINKKYNLDDFMTGLKDGR